MSERRIGRAWARVAGLVIVAGFTAASANAQGAPTVEMTVGHAEFADDSAIPHGVFGGAVRWAVTPRLGIGPEVVYMRGPGFDRDLFVTGNVTYDFATRRADRRLQAVPYVVGGAGYSRYMNRFGARSFSSHEGAVTGGGGARVWVSDRVYLGGEARVGWELHLRYAAQVGVRVGR